MTDSSNSWQVVYEHFVNFVLPAGRSYRVAEVALSKAFRQHGRETDEFRRAQNDAIREGSNMAIAFDALVDRARMVGGRSREQIYADVAPLCRHGDNLRDGVLERLSAIANAYKHYKLDEQRHPIRSADDVLAVGSGYGVDGYGVGKSGEPEVLIRLQDGKQRKLLGDGQLATVGWQTFLQSKGFVFDT